MNILVKEYQIHKVPIGDEFILKRRLLCKSDFYFYEDEDQDYIQKCLLTVKDHMNFVIFEKLFSQIDNRNRKFYTTQ